MDAAIVLSVAVWLLSNIPIRMKLKSGNDNNNMTKRLKEMPVTHLMSSSPQFETNLPVNRFMATNNTHQVSSFTPPSSVEGESRTTLSC